MLCVCFFFNHKPKRVTFPIWYLLFYRVVYHETFKFVYEGHTTGFVTAGRVGRGPAKCQQPNPNLPGVTSLQLTRVQLSQPQHPRLEVTKGLWVPVE